MQSARHKADIVRWSLNVVFFLFAVLITIIILTSQGVGIIVVAPLAVFGLATVWLMAWRRWNKTYHIFYAEELSRIQEKPSTETIDFLARLSSQELSILNYIAHGHLNKQIALKLNISESTVKTHVTVILSKLAANDRTEAVVIAIKHGLIAVR